MDDALLADLRQSTTRHKHEIELDPPQDVESVLRQELVNLWADLTGAWLRAGERVWSLGCDNLVGRIAVLTHLVGPCRWEDVDVDLLGPDELDGGIWRAVHEALGVEVEGPDPARLAEVREQIRRGPQIGG